MCILTKHLRSLQVNPGPAYNVEFKKKIQTFLPQELSWANMLSGHHGNFRILTWDIKVHVKNNY